jgi:hypothetical protein
MLALWVSVGLFTGASNAAAPTPPPVVSTMPMGGGGTIFDKWNDRRRRELDDAEWEVWMPMVAQAFVHVVEQNAT